VPACSLAVLALSMKEHLVLILNLVRCCPRPTEDPEEIRAGWECTTETTTVDAMDTFGMVIASVSQGSRYRANLSGWPCPASHWPRLVMLTKESAKGLWDVGSLSVGLDPIFSHTPNVPKSSFTSVLPNGKLLEVQYKTYAELCKYLSNKQ